MINIITISDKVLTGKRVNELSAYLCEGFFKHNLKIGTQHTISLNADVNAYLNGQQGDYIIFLIEKTCTKLNDRIAEKSKSVLVENPYVKNFIAQHYKDLNLPLEKTTEIEWKMPAKARAIINPSGATHGFISVANGITYIVLPSDYTEARKMFDDVVLDYIISEQKKQYKNYTFKTYGITENNLQLLLASEIKNKNKVSINFFDRNLVVDIVIKGESTNNELDNIARQIFIKLSNYIYTVEDIPITEVVYKLIKLNDLKVAFFEDFTGGKIVSSFCEIAEDAKNHISQGLILSGKQSKISNKLVLPETIKEYGEISVETVYEIAASMLNNTNCDIVIACTGTAGLNDGAPAGLSYIAIGDKKEIHVYKNIFKGSLSDILYNVTIASYFYTIKKLKKNDLYLSQTTV